MLFIWIYLTALFIAPQLWVEPFIGVRVDLFIYPAWLLWILATGRGRELVRFRAQDLFFIGMLAWIVLSAMVNAAGERTVPALIGYFKWFVLYRLVFATITDLSRIRSALLAVLFFGMVLAAEGIQHMHSPDGLGWAGQSFGWMDDNAAAAGVAGRTRWINIFDGPGVFCVAYTISLPVAIVLTVKPFPAAVRLVAAGMVVALLIATYYTGSRGGFLATVGVAGLFVLVRLRISVSRLVIAGGLVLAALAVAPGHLTTTKDSHKSAQRRVDMWFQGLEMVRWNMAFGVGKTNFAARSGRLIAHNSGVEIMAETGVPGFLLWVGMLYMAFRNIAAARARTEDAVTRSYLLALSLALAGYLMSAFFVTLEYETLYFLLALAAAAGYHAADPPAFSWKDAFFVAGAALAFFTLIKLVVMMYY